MALLDISAHGNGLGGCCRRVRSCHIPAGTTSCPCPARWLQVQTEGLKQSVVLHGAALLQA